MFGSIYTGMSGMAAFSAGLDVISNNVANLNTPGYKGNDLLFQDLFYGFQLSSEFNNNIASMQIGKGVQANTTTVVYSQGDLRATGVDTDVAIDGRGFFLLQDGDKQYFTRSGQFVFDQDGYLVARGTDFRVAAFDESENLSNVNLTGLRTSAPTATSKISFTNNLSTGTTRHKLDNVIVIDEAGNEHRLTFNFVNNSAETPRSWLIEIENESGEKVGDTGKISFQGNGSPEEGHNTFTFSFTPTGANPIEIELDFGKPGSFTGVTSFSGGTNSDMAVAERDGKGSGSITGIEFDREGQFIIKYSNGDEYKGGKLAIATFPDLQALQQVGSSLYITTEDNRAQLSTATNDGLGEIATKSIELSNVELTQQFTDLIIVQRGYQASSQVLTVSNEMMQQLMEVVGKK